MQVDDNKYPKTKEGIYEFWYFHNNNKNINIKDEKYVHNSNLWWRSLPETDELIRNLFGEYVFFSLFYFIYLIY